MIALGQITRFFGYSAVQTSHPEDGGPPASSVSGSCSDDSSSPLSLTQKKPISPCKKRLSARLSSRRSGGSSEENLSEKLHFSIWPKKCEKVFKDLLDQHPEELNKKYGLLLDTPLHRLETPKFFFGEMKCA